MTTDLLLVCSNSGRQLIGRNRPDRSRVDRFIALRETNNNAFSRCATPFPLFAAPTGICFIRLDFSFESACSQIGNVLHRFSQSLADLCGRFVVQSEITDRAIRRLLLIDSESSVRVAAKRYASLWCSALATPDMPTFRPTHAG